jgi:hypothetical protein
MHRSLDSFKYFSVSRPIADQKAGWLIQLGADIISMASEREVSASVYRNVGCTLLRRETIKKHAGPQGWLPDVLGDMLRSSLESTTNSSQNPIVAATKIVRWYGNLKTGANMTLSFSLAPAPKNPAITAEITALEEAFKDLTGSEFSQADYNPSPHISLVRFPQGIPQDLQREMTGYAIGMRPYEIELDRVSYG